MNDENLDESLTPYHLTYDRNIATNKVLLLKMAISTYLYYTRIADFI